MHGRSSWVFCVRGRAVSRVREGYRFGGTGGVRGLDAVTLPGAGALDYGMLGGLVLVDECELREVIDGSGAIVPFEARRVFLSFRLLEGTQWPPTTGILLCGRSSRVRRFGRSTLRRLTFIGVR